MVSTRRSAARAAPPEDGEPRSSSPKRVVRKRRVAVKPKKSTSSDGVVSNTDKEGSDVEDANEALKKKRKVAANRKKATKSDSPISGAETSDSVGNGVATKAKTKRAARRESAAGSDSREEDPTKATKPKKAKAADHQRQTERDEIPKLWDAEEALEKLGSYTFKVMSWNVAGLRALMKNHPTALPDMAKKYGFDVICLQETKLQETHVDDPKLKIRGHLLYDEGYDSYYSCATAKKGYSGTAVFVKQRKLGGAKSKGKKQATMGAFLKPKKGSKSDEAALDQPVTDNTGEIDAVDLVPVDVSYGIGKKEHDGEGRAITLDFPLFTMTALYVPNSGQKLDRLEYRTEEWDADLLAFMQRKEKDRKVPVVWLGDLNVAHTGMEVWNEGAKHLAKSAGTTPEERSSFARQLEAGYVDAFRELHPEAKGQYTYWSQRAGNRDPNKGLRLDYFVCSKSLLRNGDDQEQRVVVRDSYIIPDQAGSDHCPIVLELEIQK